MNTFKIRETSVMMRACRPAILAVAGLLAMLSPSEGRAQTSPASAERTAAMPLYAIRYEPGPNWRAGVALQEQDLRAHFFYLRDLGEKATVLVAGPMGENGGLVILSVADESAARQIMTEDPAVIAGIFVGEVEQFVPRIGGTLPLVVPSGG